MYRRGIAAGALGIALAVGLTGCFNGYQAQTSTQSEGGQVASANIGDIQLRGLLWVVPPAEEGAEPATEAYLTGTMVVTNDGQPDTLTKITVEPQGDVALSGEPVELEPNVAATIGFNASSFATLTGAEVPSAGFIPTVFTFANAGSVPVDVLTVPGVGVYADVVKESRAGAPAAEEAAAGEQTSPAAEPAAPAASPAAPQ